jgi:hypothetical protein
MSIIVGDIPIVVAYLKKMFGFFEKITFVLKKQEHDLQQ